MAISSQFFSPKSWRMRCLYPLSWLEVANIKKWTEARLGDREWTDSSGRSLWPWGTNRIGIYIWRENVKISVFFSFLFIYFFVTLVLPARSIILASDKYWSNQVERNSIIFTIICWIKNYHLWPMNILSYRLEAPSKVV